MRNRQEILDFLWGDEISDDLKQRALDATVHEDLPLGPVAWGPVVLRDESRRRALGS